MTDPDGGPGEKQGMSDEEMSAVFNALSNPRRLRILRLLTEPRYLREVASELGLSRQATHHHLDELVEAGILERRNAKRDGSSVTEYVAVPSVLSLVVEGVERVAGLPTPTADRRERTRAGEGLEPVTLPPDRRSLWVVRGLDTGTTLEIPVGNEGPWYVGRDTACDLVLEADPFASARHAEVWRESGDLLIGDLASTNGTFHNARRLTRHEDAALSHGDAISVGRSMLLFWDP